MEELDFFNEEAVIQDDQRFVISRDQLAELVRKELDAMLMQDPVAYAQQLGLSLHVSGFGDSAATTEFFQGRKMDKPLTFNVMIIDKLGQCFEGDFTRNWKFHCSLEDGHGQPMTLPNDLTGLSDMYLVDGKCEVDMADMVFGRVTSRTGDFCRLVVSIVEPEFVATAIKPWKSNKIKVTSGRCKNSEKRSWDSLDPESEVHQIPRLGDVFAKRFKQKHIMTVREVAKIDLGSADSHPPADLLAHLQGSHQNSPFTLTRMVQLVKDSRDVCRRFDVAANPTMPSFQSPFALSAQSNPMVPAQPQVHVVAPGQEQWESFLCFE